MSDDLGDRLLGDTAHAPTSPCSCVDTDWHSCLGRTGPDLHSAHLGKKDYWHQLMTSAKTVYHQ